MATWGAYFSSYVKKKDGGTPIPVESPEAEKETSAPRKVNAGVERSTTPTKKLYGSTLEKSTAEGLQRSANNSARVAKLFGYAKPKPSLAQVVDTVVKQKEEANLQLKQDPATEKINYIPSTQILTKPTVTDVAAPIPLQTTSNNKPEKEPNYVPITSSLPKESIADTVAMMSSQAILAPKSELKEEDKSELISEEIQSEPVATVPSRSLFPSLFQKSAKVPEPEVQPSAPLSLEKKKDPLGALINSMLKEETYVTEALPEDKAVSQVQVPYRESQKPSPSRKDSMFSQPPLSRRNTQSFVEDANTNPEPAPIKPLLVNRPSSSERLLSRNMTPTQNATLSLDELMLSLQSVTEMPKAEGNIKTPEKPRSPRRDRAPQKSAESLDSIMAALQADFTPAIKPKPIAAVVVQKPVRLPPTAIADINPELPPPVQRVGRSSATPSITRAPIPSVERVLTEFSEPEEEVVEIVESRAWEHAKKISEFKLQQERFEKERQRMAEEEIKFRAMEARFMEESEQQKLFVEDVRREQEREAAAELERLRVEKERLDAEEAERARLAEIAATEKREAEAERERMEKEKQMKEDAEKSRIAVEQEKNRLAWEAEKEKNAAEIARLIREEEEREMMELEELNLVRKRDDQVPPTPGRLPDLDAVSVYSDELVDSDAEPDQRIQDEGMQDERRREAEKQEYEREIAEAKLRDRREEEEERIAREKKREEQGRREQARYEQLQAERIRAQEEDLMEDLRRFEIEDEEIARRAEEEERLRYELQQDDEQGRIEEEKNQKRLFKREQDERRAYAAAEAERLQMDGKPARGNDEKPTSPGPRGQYGRQQDDRGERQRAPTEAAQAFQRQKSGRKAQAPRPRNGPSDEERQTQQREAARARQAEADEERHIEEIAARMQAEEEAAEAAESKAEKLRKAEEKIKLAFASMAAQKAGLPLPKAPLQQDQGLPLSKSAARSNGPAVLTKAPPRAPGQMRPVQRSGTISNAPFDVQAPSGVNIYNTVGGRIDGPEKTTVTVARGNTVAGGRPSAFPRGLPSGPRAGLPSGPKPNRK